MTPVGSARTKGGTFLSLLRRNGLRRALGESYRFVRGTAPMVSDGYWSLAPRYYRHRVGTDVNRFEWPVDVFKRVWVNPDRIDTFTGRRYDPPGDRWRTFGTVLTGAWDRRYRRPIQPDATGPPAHPDLFFGELFEDSLLYRSFVAHFQYDVPWKETSFVTAATEIVEEGGTVWQGATTSADIEERCSTIDALYESIRARGVESMVAMAARGEILEPFPWAIANEIVVDIGRDGSLLFANGRHRLAIAKILDVDRIPIAILVRHSEWMARRDALASDGTFDHPDLWECRPDSWRAQEHMESVPSEDPHERLS